jgi:hypothetical protein
MSHRDREGHTAAGAHAQDLSAALEWLLQGVDWRLIGLRQDCRWTARGLAAAALLWAWSDETGLLRRFAAARKIARRVWGRSVPAQASYQAFAKLLVRWTGPLLVVLTTAFRTRMRTSLAAHFRMAGYVVFGGDGSRLGLPRTASNEGRFSPAKSQRKKRRARRRKGNRPRRGRSRAARERQARHKKADSPQLWITTLWHAGTGLPWDWRIGPSDSSERHHLREMVAALPEQALVAADAGFVGYEFWSTLQDHRREFVIRVGSNVRLLKKLGCCRESGNTVYVWPDEAARKHQPPLVLRLVVVQGGRHPWYLLTSVRNAARLSDRQVAEIYRLRWGVELYYRHFKQTFERRKLRSHTADHVEVEAHWSMLGLWALLLHAQHYLHRRHVPPERISVASVLRAYRTPMREFKSSPDPGESLWDLLKVALVDPYQRTNKASRGHPRKKYEQPPGAPKLQTATPQQVLAAKQLQKPTTEKGLTA